MVQSARQQPFQPLAQVNKRGPVLSGQASQQGKIMIAASKKAEVVKDNARPPMTLAPPKCRLPC
jgi:hypothetical protein